MPISPYLFEVSWEVCNKVGGIHTVITSKLPYSLNQFSSHYTAIGPYLVENNQEFKPLPLPTDLEETSKRLSERGVDLHYGQWLVDEATPVILLDWKNLMSSRDPFKEEWWKLYQLDTLGTDFYDVDQPLFWSLSVGFFLEAFAETHKDPVIAHAHEWLTAGLFLYINSRNAPVKTVFTTHATVLGRALSSSAVPIYDTLQDIDPELEAKNHGVTTKHQLERLAATLATVFSTVSTLTAQECSAFLGRNVDVVVENGIDLNDFPLFDQASTSHASVREKLHDFISAYFFSSYQFDLRKTIYQFTMGRFEIHNKGYDLYIESLGELNTQLKAEKSDQTLVSFFLVPMGNALLRPEVQRQISLYNRITRSLHKQAQQYQRETYASLWQEGSSIRTNTTEDSSRLVDQFGHIEPALSPYQLPEDHPIFELAKKAGLQNSAEDPVKLVLFPIYMDGFDGIFNMPLYELIIGFDLGVFPSLYEPWGYTPLETIALGIPTITSNLSGFGQAIQNTLPNALGTLILDRHHGSNNLTDLLRTNLEESPRQWMLRRIDAYTTAHRFSWNTTYQKYQNAYELALKRT